MKVCWRFLTWITWREGIENKKNVPMKEKTSTTTSYVTSIVATFASQKKERNE
jgi:hypothetical protein